ncbi:15411_t:CDS:2 [Dentiscutata heterogama]|uniref:15411_t:CDS:1 n=1 Tax=Dentiscutata heterogama TaxID=1316150 RepID=A0ACA9L0P2_9GLOM|nr:15411_t:CDS:2 [Dentiscutata heterogama]
MYLSKRKKDILQIKICQKYSYETYISLKGLQAINLRKKELVKWLKEEQVTEAEKYFKLNFLHIFNLESYLKLYKNNFSLREETIFGNNFTTIISDDDYRKQLNNEKSPAFVVKEFVRKQWDQRNNFGKLSYCNDEKHYREKMGWRLKRVTILNLKKKSETEIDVILEEKLTDYKFSPSSFSNVKQ